MNTLFFVLDTVFSIYLMIVLLPLLAAMGPC